MRQLQLTSNFDQNFSVINNAVRKVIRQYNKNRKRLRIINEQRFGTTFNRRPSRRDPVVVCIDINLENRKYPKNADKIGVRLSKKLNANLLGGKVAMRFWVDPDPC